MAACFVDNGSILLENKLGVHEIHTDEHPEAFNFHLVDKNVDAKLSVIEKISNSLSALRTGFRSDVVCQARFDSELGGVLSAGFLKTYTAEAGDLLDGNEGSDGDFFLFNQWEDDYHIEL